MEERQIVCCLNVQMLYYNITTDHWVVTNNVVTHGVCLFWLHCMRASFLRWPTTAASKCMRVGVNTSCYKFVCTMMSCWKRVCNKSCCKYVCEASYYKLWRLFHLWVHLWWNTKLFEHEIRLKTRSLDNSFNFQPYFLLKPIVHCEVSSHQTPRSQPVSKSTLTHADIMKFREIT